jgi:hypothetical protein
MMGDDMAIRSGGMYGRPESKYTVATPSQPSSWMDSASTYGKLFKAGAGMYSALQNYKYSQKQAELNLEALQKERLYNVANFKQQMADTLAQNKMSFYASGLDYTGTAMSVTMSNQTALQDELNMMEYNYDIQEKNIKNSQKAAKRQLYGNVISSVASLF